MTTDLTIEREILIDAPAVVVWQTITEPKQIEEWFADRVQLDLRPGGAGSLFFDEMGSGHEPTTAALVVEVVDPPNRFSFRWSHPQGDAPTAGNSVLVEFTLTAETNEQTRLRVTETGLDTLGWSDDDKAHYADDHRHGWQVIFGRLGERFTNTTG